MKNKILISMIFMSIFGILLLLPLGSSFMPKYTHKFIFDQSVKETIDSDFYRACSDHLNLCYAGNVLSDISVIYYWTGKDLYSATHSPAFCKSALENSVLMGGEYNLEEQKACAIGICTHQSADIVAHSRIGGTSGREGMVSYAITHSLLVNEISHVLAEQHEDNWVENTYGSTLATEAENYLESYETCRDLVILTMLGDNAYQQTGITKADLEGVFDDFVREVVNSQQTGYNPAFKQKSFLGTIDSIPTVIMGIYIFSMLVFLLISVLLIIKLIKRDFRIRLFIGLLIFLPIFLVMLYLFIGAIQGKAFEYFIGVIKPISNLVPIGNPQSYLDDAILNTKQLFQQGNIWLEGTDASGRASFPVLDEANSKVLIYDYIILGTLVLTFIWFIWFLFKRNKKTIESFGSFSL